MVKSDFAARFVLVGSLLNFIVGTVTRVSDVENVGIVVRKEPLRVCNKSVR